MLGKQPNVTIFFMDDVSCTSQAVEVSLWRSSGGELLLPLRLQTAHSTLWGSCMSPSTIKVVNVQLSNYHT